MTQSLFYIILYAVFGGRKIKNP